MKQTTRFPTKESAGLRADNESSSSPSDLPFCPCLKVFASIHARISFYFNIRIFYFYFFTYSYFKILHVRLSILQYISLKYKFFFIFFNCYLFFVFHISYSECLDTAFRHVYVFCLFFFLRA